MGERALRSALEFYAAPENWTEPNQANSQELFDTAMGLDLGSRAREALACYAPTPAVEQWQPIESAPKDGRHVILYCDYYGVGRCAWEGWRKVWRSDDPSHGIGFPHPTHWMPLPDFPPGSVRAENARLTALAATTEAEGSTST